MMNRADKFVERIFGNRNGGGDRPAEVTNAPPTKTAASEMFKLLDKRRARILALRSK